jgi:RNA polymerase sigma factor (sigma-70 family)
MLMERTINKRLTEEVMRIAMLPLDLEKDTFVEEELTYETANPETIEALMEFATAETILEEQEFKVVIQDLLASLTPRESKVLKLRFGIGIEKEHTLEEIASIFDVTRERIRQIEARVLRKMRHPSRSDRLKPFVEAAGERIHRHSIFNEPFPDIDDFWGAEGIVEYSYATAAWNERRKASKMKLEMLRAQLKKGTLV